LTAKSQLSTFGVLRSCSPCFGNDSKNADDEDYGDGDHNLSSSITSQASSSPHNNTAACTDVYSAQHAQFAEILIQQMQISASAAAAVDDDGGNYPSAAYCVTASYLLRLLTHGAIGFCSGVTPHLAAAAAAAAAVRAVGTRRGCQT
jgi:hypothetical protein